jgi:type I phosphodiesterase/nucleotide pyrophosphatase
MRKSAAALFVACMLSALSLSSFAQWNAGPTTVHRRFKHVLLISVDGLHALDLSNYVAGHSNSTLAYLSSHGVTYSNATSSQPSDSFPGLAALVTGGSPVTTGLWYDDTYNRRLSPPLMTDGLGTIVALDEAIDSDLTQLNTGIHPAYLVRDPDKGCAVVLPHQYLRVNTVFEVVKAHGGSTAWTDKHPSYEWTNGPSGTGVDDFWGPEINSIPVALPFAGCTPVPAPESTPDDGWTKDTRDTQCYDLLHVQAVVNQIDGWNHDHTRHVGVPTVFGTNFQSVSVGQKLAGNGYTDVLGTPSAGLAGQLDFIDASLGQIVAELKKQGLWDSTLIIIGAKHGQSPIDPSKRVGIGGGQPGATIGPLDAFDLSDDGSLIWLTDQTQTANVVATLAEPATQTALGIQEIFALQSLANRWDDPAVDPRTPDIVLKTNTGVIFTGGHKIAEHGGLNEDDVHVALLVSGAALPVKTVHSAVNNQQVAATILRALDMNPNELQAVQKEQVHPLPELF